MEIRSRTRRWSRWRLILPLTVIIALLAEHWRGEWSLRRYKSGLAAQGEVFDAGRLWPRASVAGMDFSNQLARAVHQLPPGFMRCIGFSGMQPEQPGRCRRGSQEPRPMVRVQTGPVAGWEDLNVLAREAEPALASLRRLLKHPPSGIAYTISEKLEDISSFPNFVNVRLAAQALQTAALNDLHTGDLAGAVENLTALSAFARLHADDPSLVNLMIRVAILGLFNDTCWDALQARGWTEPQLATLQRACQEGNLLSRLPKALEAERALRLYDLNWFRSHSYGRWITRWRPLCESFGVPSQATDAPTPGRAWRELVFHPLWSFAWAGQEESDYLHQAQRDLMAARQAVQNGSWLQLSRALAANHGAYRSPWPAWRLYSRLPLADQLLTSLGSPRVAPPSYPYPDFSKAWLAIFQNLTVREMVRAAIAVKRYELREGRPPPNLAALAPEFLAVPPRDFMDGQPLRYRLNPDDTVTLYSVGKDGRDDGGIPFPDGSTESLRDTSPWSGRDWVWPRDVSAGRSPKDSGRIARLP